MQSVLVRPSLAQLHAANYSAYRPQLPAAAPLAVAPRAAGTPRTTLLLIDVQNDFCYADGSLFVAGRNGNGAEADNVRLADFIYRNAPQLDHIVATLDTHQPLQIFFASFWEHADGTPAAPHCAITLADVSAGRMRPSARARAWAGPSRHAWLQAQVQHYCEQLERQGNYALYLWPPHCLVGTQGHAMVPLVYEACWYAASVAAAEFTTVTKGEAVLTENYSALQPEVARGFDGTVLGTPNDDLLTTLLQSDRIIVAGQAASHCVKSTIDDLFAAAQARAQRLPTVYILQDCMSSVVVRDASERVISDFTDVAEAAFSRWAESGAHLVTSAFNLTATPLR